LIVPAFWAEAAARHRANGQQVTIRRFGWSDTSAEEAQAMANERADAALASHLAGSEVIRREPKRAYNGADGVPIREEILSRHGNAIITRNSYGAHCLNTPEVFFADIDFADLGDGGGVGGGLRGLFGLLTGRGRESGTPEERARGRIDRFLASHPRWRFRLYRTPAGMRVAATHATLDPRSREVAECFQALGADAVYVRMCQKQNCFRARLTAKPFRIGIGDHIRPRYPVWPVPPETLPGRLAWIGNYEQRAAGYAACRFLGEAGTALISGTAMELIELHDTLSSARRHLPLA